MDEGDSESTRRLKVERKETAVHGVVLRVNPLVVMFTLLLRALHLRPIPLGSHPHSGNRRWRTRTWLVRLLCA